MSKKKIGIIVFPGSNCDADCYHLIQNTLQQSVEYVWHKETILKKFDVIILPGGFSYGDYLRCGAIAKFSPIMKEVHEYAKRGGVLIGICNGFQILIEAGLLPGALMRNQKLKFICDSVHLRLKNNQTFFTNQGTLDQVYKMPIAHMDGNYFIDSDGLKRLEDQQQIVFQYSHADGRMDEKSNPNGSVHHIAGICNETGRILGMMPHPERVSEAILGGKDGRFIFESVLRG